MGSVLCHRKLPHLMSFIDVKGAGAGGGGGGGGLHQDFLDIDFLVVSDRDE